MNKVKKTIKGYSKYSFGKTAYKLASLFQQENFEIYAVGGCVRDLLLSQKPHDVDFCTNAKPDEIIGILIRNNIEYFPLGIKFGTVVAKLGNEEFEITTFRNDKNQDGRYCDVDFVSSLEDDLKRRDFTINAMTYDFVNEKIIDYFDGYNDIQNKTINTVGNPKERFEEDALRIVRAFRFSIKLDFYIHPITYHMMIGMIHGHALDKISKERLSKELMTILSIDNLSMNNLEFLAPFLFYLMPELRLQYGYNQNNKYHCYSLYEHTCKTTILAGTAIEGVSKDFYIENRPLIRLAALLHDVGKPYCMVVGKDGENHYYKHNVVGCDMSKEILKKLKFSNKEIEFVSSLILYHDADFKGDNIKSVKKLIKKVGPKNMPALFSLMIADKKAQNMEYSTMPYLNIILGINNYVDLLNKNEIMDIKLCVTGHDIIDYFKIEPSKEVGRLLKLATDAVEDEKVENKKEAVLNYLENLEYTTN